MSGGAHARASMWGGDVPDAVREFLRFQLTINVVGVLISFVSAVGSEERESLLRPVQLLWLNLIMDTFAALALATEGPTESLLERDPVYRQAPLVSRRMWVFDAVHGFVDRTNLYDVQITVQTPFPGTPLYARLEREGRLTHPGQWNRCTLFDVNYQPRGMTSAQLEAGMVDLTKRLYAPGFVKQRREAFVREWRSVQRARRVKRAG